MSKKRGNKDSVYKVFRLLLIALIIILVWRGINGLINEFLFPENEILSDVASIVIAVVIFVLAKIRLKELD
ncbi:MAG: hypothetical protein KBC00_00395 [Candidatus Levybacteria bacterium]|nr:hypothetical protein [Candidatus Levybacteria bacterium]MBP9815166.1 hypothetical protein [Candidatus Levybacteria bacterium]